MGRGDPRRVGEPTRRPGDPRIGSGAPCNGPGAHAAGLRVLAAVVGPWSAPGGSTRGGGRAPVSDRGAAAAGRGLPRPPGGPETRGPLGPAAGARGTAAEPRMHRSDVRNFVIGFQTFAGSGAPGRRGVLGPQSPPPLAAPLRPTIHLSVRKRRNQERAVRVPGAPRRFRGPRLPSRWGFEGLLRGSGH